MRREQCAAPLDVDGAQSDNTHLIIILIAGPSLLIAGPRRPRRLRQGTDSIINYRVMTLMTDERGAPRRVADMSSPAAADMSITGRLDAGHSSPARPPARPPTRSGRAQALFRSRISRRFSGGTPAPHPSIPPDCDVIRPVLVLLPRAAAYRHA